MQADFLGEYRLLRKIGAGGFGAVYLARKGGGEKYFAVKAVEKDKSPREISAFEKYQSLSLSQKSFMLPIVGFGFQGDIFYCAMPLADALKTSENISPENPNWEARTLSNEIRLMSESPKKEWFSARQMREIIMPIFDAAIFLGENGMLHRDIKPDNILFFGGKPRLSDFGLLADDTRRLSGLGTPFFSAPNWYLSSGGNPDMYGLATTFYMLISGNTPDLVGRAAYNCPEKIKDTLTETERERYRHWMRCLYRALSQAPNERYIRLQDFLAAILSDDFESSKEKPGPAKKFSAKKLALAAACAAVFAAVLYPAGKPKNSAPGGQKAETAEPPEIVLKNEYFSANYSAEYPENIRRTVDMNIPYSLYKEIRDRGYTDAQTKENIPSFEERKRHIQEKIEETKDLPAEFLGLSQSNIAQSIRFYELEMDEGRYACVVKHSVKKILRDRNRKAAR